MFERVLNMRLKYKGRVVLYDFSYVFLYPIHMQEITGLVKYPSQCSLRGDYLEKNHTFLVSLRTLIKNSPSVESEFEAIN